MKNYIVKFTLPSEGDKPIIGTIVDTNRLANKEGPDSPNIVGIDYYQVVDLKGKVYSISPAAVQKVVGIPSYNDLLNTFLQLLMQIRGQIRFKEALDTFNKNEKIPFRIEVDFGSKKLQVVNKEIDHESTEQ